MLCGIVIAITGVLVQKFTEAMTDWKFDTCNELIDDNGNRNVHFTVLSCINPLLLIIDLMRRLGRFFLRIYFHIDLFKWLRGLSVLVGTISRWLRYSGD